MAAIWRASSRCAATRSVLLLTARTRGIGGAYPHLAMFNRGNICGAGAVVPSAYRLWVLAHSPHQPNGSGNYPYEIDTALRQVIRPGSLGGTPANAMIHRESRQFFIGPYL